MLNLSLSSYYYKPKEQVAPEIKKENDLLDHIERIALEFPCYGYRRITHQLEREGETINGYCALRAKAPFSPQPRENGLRLRILTIVTRDTQIWLKILS